MKAHAHTSTFVPATTYAKVNDKRVSYGMAEGQLVKYFHDRPETTIIEVADEKFGVVVAKMLAYGYITEADAVDFVRSIAGDDRIARAGVFGIDGMVNNVAGYTYGDTWNGWQCPMFTKDAGLQIVAAWDTTGGDTLSYDADIDAFVEVTGDDRTTFEGKDIDIADGTVRVYGIGAFGWTWDRAENVGGVDEETPVMSYYNNMTLHSAYMAFGEAAVALRQEIGACMEQGRDDQSNLMEEPEDKSDVDAYLENAYAWARKCAGSIEPPEDDDLPPEQPAQIVCHCTDGFAVPNPKCGDCGGTGFAKDSKS